MFSPGQTPIKTKRAPVPINSHQTGALCKLLHGSHHKTGAMYLMISIIKFSNSTLARKEFFDENLLTFYLYFAYNGL